MTESAPGLRSFSWDKRHWLGAGITAAIAIAFLSLWFNRFVGLHSGCGSYMWAPLMAKGLMPYRDFFMPSPPISLARGVAVIDLFGNYYINMKIYGFVIRTIEGVVTYLWLRRMFKVSHAAMAAATIVIVGSGCTADCVDYYPHEAILMQMIAGLFVSYGIQRDKTIKSMVPLVVLSGLFTSLGVLIKQNAGLPCAVAMPVLGVMAFGGMPDFRKRALAFLGSYFAGFAIPVVITLLWLFANGALGQFFMQNFVIGPKAKAGSPIDFLTREILFWHRQQFNVLMSWLVIALTFPLFRKSAASVERPPGGELNLLIILFLGLLAVAAGGWIAYQEFSPVWLKVFTGGWQVIYVAMWASLFGSLAQGIYLFVRWCRYRLTEREAQFIFYAGLSFCLAFGLSLSAPIQETFAEPGLGLLLCTTLDMGRPWVQVATYVISTLLIMFTTNIKVNVPWSFDGFDEPRVKDSTATSTLEKMRGFRIHPKYAEFIDETVNYIDKNTKPDDTIFVYPEMAVFYALAERRWTTLSYSHNFDIMNDKFAREEAQRILKNRPKVLIYYREPLFLFKDHELVWRNGKPSGHRDIIAACEQLAKEYKLVKAYRLPPNQFYIGVFARPDTVPSNGPGN